MNLKHLMYLLIGAAYLIGTGWLLWALVGDGARASFAQAVAVSAVTFALAAITVILYAVVRDARKRTRR